MRTRWVLLIAMFSLALGSCGGAAANQSPNLASPNPQEIPTQEPPSDLPENPLQFANTPETVEMPSNPPPAEKFVSLSKKDLATRLQIDAEKIALIDATEILWPDAALGCPMPGKVYAQGRVPGYRIRLEVEKTEYVYHTDFTGLIIFCPEVDPDNPESVPPTTSGPTPNIGVPID